MTLPNQIQLVAQNSDQTKYQIKYFDVSEMISMIGIQILSSKALNGPTQIIYFQK